MMAPIHDWNVHFHDESREIASEYRGGLAKYGALEDDPPYPVDNSGLLFDFGAAPSHPVQQPGLPPIHGMLQDPYQEDHLNIGTDGQQREPYHRHTHSHQSESTYSGSNLPTTSGTAYGSVQVAPADGPQHIRDPNELYFMQAFIEEVGLWMDSMDPHKHVSVT